MFGKRILLLIPHPDDEVVAYAATLEHARQKGAKIFALYLTHGCVAQETMWPWQRSLYTTCVTRRRYEAEKAARHLGIKALSWSARPARHLWRNLPAIYAELQQTIDAYAINQLWVPAYEGGNADHDGANALGHAFSDRLSVLEFAEYNFFGRKKHAQEFPFSTGTEQTILLTPHEQASKRALLGNYASEQGNLNYVEVNQECFRPLAPYDYSKPPHEGTLWYTRFQWVPFRHPRVDFTKPEEVCAAITEFLSGN
ncbi:MAG: PIG-L family deacetylase [Alphaproteobacteria bacterium]|nr:PIG-L family deacetylase [Alphaproteobacteria bacterium]